MPQFEAPVEKALKGVTDSRADLMKASENRFRRGGGYIYELCVRGGIMVLQ